MFLKKSVLLGIMHGIFRTHIQQENKKQTEYDNQSI